MTKLETIKADAVFQQVLKDSFGGVMYNVANYGKYDAGHILAIWDSMTPSEQSISGGIIKGAIHFLQGR